MMPVLFSQGNKSRIQSFVIIALLVGAVSFAQVREAVPVLCYHGFAEDTSAIRGKLTEPYAQFEEMLRFLAKNGYQPSFPEELQTVGPDMKKPIIITFDDGRKEQLRAAALMQKYGMKGLFFVIPSRISEESNEYLTPADLAMLTSWGHQIGVHGYAHRSMVESPEETEAVRNAALGVVKAAVPSQRVFPSFAFPFGHYDTSVVDLTMQGYRYLHTVNPGYWDRRSNLLPRMLITRDKPPIFFEKYIRESSRFNPPLVAITQNGGRRNVVSFRLTDTVAAAVLEILAVSADRDGYHYTSHKVGDHASIHGNVLLFDLRKHLESFYQTTRMVLSYAFVKRDSSVFYVSSGQTHWVEK